MSPVRLAAMTSIRSPPSTSLTSLIECSWPTASGVSVSGNGTLSLSGSTGSASGSRVCTSRSCGPSPEAGISITRPSPIGTRRAVSSGRASGTSTTSIPSS